MFTIKNKKLDFFPLYTPIRILNYFTIDSLLKEACILCFYVTNAHVIYLFWCHSSINGMNIFNYNGNYNRKCFVYQLKDKNTGNRYQIDLIVVISFVYCNWMYLNWFILLLTIYIRSYLRFRRRIPE